MTASAWLAMAAFCAVTLLPTPRGVRLVGLGSAGRLVPPPQRVRRHPASESWAAFVAVIGAAAVVTAVWARAGPIIALAAALIVALGARLAVDARQRRSAQRLRTDVVTAARVLAGELRAGSDPAAALGAAAEAAPLVTADLRAAAGRARQGLAAQDVLAESAHEAVRTIGLAWHVGATTGCALADVLTRVVADLETVAAQRRATAVALAGPRSSAAVLAGLPVLGVALGAAMGAHPLGFLLDSAPGRVVCLAGTVLDAAGVLWVRQILCRSEAP